MVMAIVSDEWMGPPSVSTQTRSNSWMAPMMDRKALMRIVGPSSGSVTWRKTFQPVAPSSWAASISSLGMPCRPARYRIMWKPKYFQVMTMNTEYMTLEGSDSQVELSSSSPIMLSISLARPRSGEKNIVNSTAVMISDSTYGAKNSNR